MGAVMGIPIKHHISLMRCSASLSVPNVCRTFSALSGGMTEGGKLSSTFSPLLSSSFWRREDSGGTDLSPHSWKGIRLRAWFP